MPYVEADGIELYYEERGSGPPLLLLTGLGADGSVWEQHAQAYERHFRCLLLDNRGAGRSGKPQGPYSTKRMGDDAAALIDALDLDGVHVSGISMGGAIAQHLAAVRPERIASLSLHGSWAHCDAYTKSVFGMMGDVYGAVSPVVFAKLLNAWIFVPSYANSREEDMRERAASADSPNRMPAHAFQAQCEACAGHDARSLLGDLRMPTLVTAGDKDIFLSPAYSEELAAAIPFARLEMFPGSGHTHHWDSLDRFNALTLAFMREHDATGSGRKRG
ncbi:alpha/beta fold hydrolase [Cohnella sp. GCM10027633]|uniref:alpha/beta fold hydrolase n=1 Tax=unclassified Cohnella TaxID=2636738 RepID=UPI003640DD33